MNAHPFRMLALVLFAWSFSQMAMAEDSKPDNAAIIAKQKPAYPLKTCLVSGDKLDGEMGGIDYVHEGRLIRFCCKDCIKDFKKEPAKFLKVLDDVEAKAKAAK